MPSSKSNSSSSSKQWNTQKVNTWSKPQYLRTKGQRKTYKKYAKARNKAEKAYNSAIKKGFTAPYQSQVNGLLNKIQNSKFEYDLNKDALYNQYKEQYTNMGNVAMQEAQADATAQTGGYSNSYAATAGQRAFNSYLDNLKNLVPSLYAQARSNYDTNLSNMYNQANLFQGMNQQAFAEYQTKLDQLATNREYANNKAYNYYMSTQRTVNGGTTSNKGGSSSRSSQSSKTSKK